MQKSSAVLQLKTSNCMNCYKCIRNCSVKAIRVRDGHAQIVEPQCILCERCMVVCPQSAKVEQNMVPDIEQAFDRGERLIASVHPAILARNPEESFETIRQVLKKLGFSDAFEASKGACLMFGAYERELQTADEKKAMISSDCPVVIRLVKRYYSELSEHLMPVQSVMQIHANYLHAKDPSAKIVSISPCISVMDEMAETDSRIDYVVTFQELSDWLRRREIDTESIARESEQQIHTGCPARAAALPDGIIRSMRQVEGWEYLSVHGVDACKNVLEELKHKKMQGCFIEMHSCENGCVAGTSFQKEKRGILGGMLAIRRAAFDETASCDTTCLPDKQELAVRRVFKVPFRIWERMPPEAEIAKVLASIGKFSEKDELNCGACGYDTCREKAIAICRNKAEVAMCVPYMRSRQADYSSKVFDAMPGLLVTVDYQLKIVQMNQAAKDLFDIHRKRNLIGKPVSEIMEDYKLADIISFERKIMVDEIYLSEEKRYLERVLTNDRKNHMILCVMKDVTKERLYREQVNHARREAARIADHLVEEQLKIVHQIAGLLGETAADTKVAVEELKNTILQNDRREI